MKKLLTALFATAAIAVSAQTARSGSWAIEFPKDGKAINVSQTFTPFFKIENEERVIDMRLNERDMNNAKHWLTVDVVFSTNSPKSAMRSFFMFPDLFVDCFFSGYAHDTNRKYSCFPFLSSAFLQKI